ncbi:hypothetical protein C2G38_2138292 [Gigaspora rosea]|uniref:Uncharacterized protein n=1 Tax=Gigaspora rosea TaxID=44941 RepID=A0A397W4W1_9GLOM|nr:hypothetical protein C2G38_2138292 [Gigaspora rosea]
MSNETAGASQAEPLIDLSKIDVNTKAYIDAPCQASANSIIDSIKSYIDQSMGLQFNMISKLNKRLDDYVNQQPTQNVQPKEQNPAPILEHNHEYNPTAAFGSNSMNMEKSLPQQSNCPLTPILNNLIISTAKQPNEKSTASSNEAQGMFLPNKAIKVKAFTRTYPSLDYSDLANLPLVYGFQNNQAASVEQIRLWWVLNWNEGQKIIEMLPNKPNLLSRLWKAIAIGFYVDLNEFGYRNLKANLKNNDDEQTLHTTEGGIIAIRKRSHPQKFTNIAEWLLAFKSYMDSVLIIYPMREQEFNTYRDNINTLCVKHDFLAVASYDKDKRLYLTIN